MKKIILLIFIVFFSFTLSACNSQKIVEYENSYFKYVIIQDNPNTSKKICLYGLTELGLQQTNIIIPEYIDGLKVDELGYYKALGGMWVGKEVVPFTVGDSMKKIFIPYKFTNENNYYVNLNIEAINAYVISWNEIITSDFLIKNDVISYNLYKYACDNDSYSPKYLANVSYMYNYENSPNDGYYWADIYDNSLITFVPPIPNRNGYVFDGWYKEAECINKWEFECDITGDILSISNNKYEEYPGTYLYAKWSIR